MIKRICCRKGREASWVSLHLMIYKRIYCRKGREVSLHLMIYKRRYCRKGREVSWASFHLMIYKRIYCRKGREVSLPLMKSWTTVSPSPHLNLTQVCRLIVHQENVFYSVLYAVSCSHPCVSCVLALHIINEMMEGMDA